MCDFNDVCCKRLPISKNWKIIVATYLSCTLYPDYNTLVRYMHLTNLYFSPTFFAVIWDLDSRMSLSLWKNRSNTMRLAIQNNLKSQLLRSYQSGQRLRLTWFFSPPNILFVLRSNSNAVLTNDTTSFPANSRWVPFSRILSILVHIDKSSASLSCYWLVELKRVMPESRIHWSRGIASKNKSFSSTAPYRWSSPFSIGHFSEEMTVDDEKSDIHCEGIYRVIGLGRCYWKLSVCYVKLT